MRRFNQAEIADRLERKDACVTSVQLTDRLSDSGVIAAIVAERLGQQLMVEELCVSCRALAGNWKIPSSWSPYGICPFLLAAGK